MANAAHRLPAMKSGAAPSGCAVAARDRRRGPRPSSVSDGFMVTPIICRRDRPRLGMLAGHVLPSTRRCSGSTRPGLAAPAVLGVRRHADRLLGLALLRD